MRYSPLFLLTAALLLSACRFWPPASAPNPDPNHTHADFAVWIEGKQLDFSGAKYMSGIASDERSHPKSGLRQYLHLHDGNGHVIHRHKPGLTFGDFLVSLGFTPQDSSSSFLRYSKLCFSPTGGTPVCWHTTDSDDWQFFVNGKGSQCGPTEDCLHPFLVAWTYVFEDGHKLLLTYKASDDEVANELKQMTDDACLYSQTCPSRGEAPTENCVADPEVPCVE